MCDTQKHFQQSPEITRTYSQEFVKSDKMVWGTEVPSVGCPVAVWGFWRWM